MGFHFSVLDRGFGYRIKLPKDPQSYEQSLRGRRIGSCIVVGAWLLLSLLPRVASPGVSQPVGPQPILTQEAWGCGLLGRARWTASGTEQLV